MTRYRRMQHLGAISVWTDWMGWMDLRVGWGKEHLWCWQDTKLAGFPISLLTFQIHPFFIDIKNACSLQIGWISRINKFWGGRRGHFQTARLQIFFHMQILVLNFCLDGRLDCILLLKKASPSREPCSAKIMTPNYDKQLRQRGSTW